MRKESKEILIGNFKREKQRETKNWKKKIYTRVVRRL